MKRRVAIGVTVLAVAAVVAGVTVPRAQRRAHTYRLLDSLAALPLGLPLESLRRVIPWLYCPEMTHHMEHEPVCAAEADGRDVRVELPGSRIGVIEMMVFGRDMPDLVSWTEARFGAPRGRCTLDDIRLAWWFAGGRVVTLTEPPPGGRARKVAIQAGDGAPPGCV